MDVPEGTYSRRVERPWYVGNLSRLNDYIIFVLGKENQTSYLHLFGFGGERLVPEQRPHVLKVPSFHATCTARRFGSYCRRDK